MQTLKPISRLRRGFGADRPIRTVAEAERRELRLGIIGALAVVIALAIAGVLYVAPFGKATYSADLTEAGSVKAGDDVRVAGVPVGTVKSIELGSDHVRMIFAVDDDVFIGDQTRLEIRMLTAAGGHYVAVLPAGAEPLGRQVIPADRVKLPYSLMQAFQDAEKPFGEMDGDVLRRNFAALQNSLVDSPDGLRRLGGAVGTIVDILDKQNADISRTLAVADEYVGLLDSNRSTIGRLVTKINSLETIALSKQTEIVSAVTVTVRVVARIAALEPVWRTRLAPLSVELAAAMPELQDLGRRFAGTIATIRDMGQRVQHLITPSGFAVDQGAAVATVSGVCVPVPGMGC